MYLVFALKYILMYLYFISSKYDILTPEFLDLDYKIQPVSNHVAKFQGDRSRELGEGVVKQKKHHGLTVKQNTSRTTVRQYS